MVAVAYTRWSFTRGSNCKALTGEITVFWIGGRLWELVAYEWWSHKEVRRYLNLYLASRLGEIKQKNIFFNAEPQVDFKLVTNFTKRGINDKCGLLEVQKFLSPSSN